MAGFKCMYSHGFLRVASCVPRGRVADPVSAARAHLELAVAGHARHVGVMLFPEPGLSSYAIDDLVVQDALLDRVEAAVAEIVAASRDLYSVLVVGAPLRRDGRLFNAAVVIHRGRVIGVMPKSYLPNYREFYELRHFAPGVGLRGGTVVGHEAPFGADLLFRSNGSAPFTFHVEICEDIWVPAAPSTRAAMAGAELLLNLLVPVGFSDLEETGRNLDVVVGAVRIG
jgi:NAD+ synthase (glutamine-hydrolysing)